MSAEDETGAPPSKGTRVSFGEEEVDPSDMVINPPEIAIPQASNTSAPSGATNPKLRFDGKKAQSVSTSLIQREIGRFKDEDDEVDDERLKMFIRNVIKEKRRAEETRKWLYVSLVALLLLCASNIGTAYLAVYLAKDTEVKDSQFVSKATGERVGVMGMGEMLDVKIPPQNDRRRLNDVSNSTAQASEGRYFCVQVKDWARLWIKAEGGGSVGLNAVFDESSEEEEEGVMLKWTGSRLFADEACFESEYDDIQFCLSLDDENELCSDEEERRNRRVLRSGDVTSMENANGHGSGTSIQTPSRKDMFHTYLKAYRNREHLENTSGKNVHEVKDVMNLRRKLFPYDIWKRSMKSPVRY